MSVTSVPPVRIRSVEPIALETELGRSVVTPFATIRTAVALLVVVQDEDGQSRGGARSGATSRASASIIARACVAEVIAPAARRTRRSPSPGRVDAHDRDQQRASPAIGRDRADRRRRSPASTSRCTTSPASGPGSRCGGCSGGAARRCPSTRAWAAPTTARSTLERCLRAKASAPSRCARRGRSRITSPSCGRSGRWSAMRRTDARRQRVVGRGRRHRHRRGTGRREAGLARGADPRRTRPQDAWRRLRTRRADAAGRRREPGDAAMFDAALARTRARRAAARRHQVGRLLRGRCRSRAASSPHGRRYCPAHVRRRARPARVGAPARREQQPRRRAGSMVSARNPARDGLARPHAGGRRAATSATRPDLDSTSTPAPRAATGSRPDALRRGTTATSEEISDARPARARRPVWPPIRPPRCPTRWTNCGIAGALSRHRRAARRHRARLRARAAGAVRAKVQGPGGLPLRRRRRQAARAGAEDDEGGRHGRHGPRRRDERLGLGRPRVAAGAAPRRPRHDHVGNLPRPRGDPRRRLSGMGGRRVPAAQPQRVRIRLDQRGHRDRTASTIRPGDYVVADESGAVVRAAGAGRGSARRSSRGSRCRSACSSSRCATTSSSSWDQV